MQINIGKNIFVIAWLIIMVQFLNAQPAFNNITIDGNITNVQPMTGIVFWQGSNTNTDAISLEFSYMLFNQVVTDSGQYNWQIVDDKLADIASRGHQAIFRFRDTYVGKQTSVPDYIKNMPGYTETKGLSEGKTTWFPDWTNAEWQRFYIEFYTKFAQKYDSDPRIAFIQVGFGLWAEYHIYDGPFELGKTFPSKEFQTGFFTAIDTLFVQTPWSISIDAADETYSPFSQNPNLTGLKFGNFDDSFMCQNHSGYNKSCWDFFGAQRYTFSPAGGEFSYYTTYDQQHVLDYPNGIHGKSFEQMAKDFKISYIIGNDQPNYQSISRIKQASMASGYKFKIIWAKTTPDSTIMLIQNIGVAPIYYDAWPTINGVKAKQSLKNLAAGGQREFNIASGGNNPVVTIECNRLVPGQKIEFYGTSYNNIKNQKTGLLIYPTVVNSNSAINIVNTQNNYKILTAKVFNMRGQLVCSHNLNNSKWLINNNLLPGTYIVQLVHLQQVIHSQKIIVN